ncbi:DinB family protein [Bacillus sp. NEB1478]|uniref:DinB family protein n=1 Tax=Bacillus sp. NEB1478 TaxID=3073816 RepID=UPI002873C530|nr:DinB family protein [Bacillus sp. NEB1478]WNB91913.1 DinB family protein [Bacillus sp. NEB1478]
MNEVIVKYKNFTKWLETIKRMPEEYWLVEIKEGKWSVGEIVSHIKAWDNFVWNERVEYFINGTELTNKNFDPEEINKNAADEARSGISKNELIHEVVECRFFVAKMLEEVPAPIWERKIELGKGVVTLSEYIEGLVEHDQHHQSQIEEFLLFKGIDIHKQEV